MRDAARLEEKSLRRVRFPAQAGIPDGMEQQPFESRRERIAEGHRVRRRSNRSLRAFQGARQHISKRERLPLCAGSTG